jgi:quinol monooxygenase YgiN
MNFVVVLGQIDLHPEDAAAAEELMRVMSLETRKEAGCIQYAYARDVATPHRFQLSELWQSEDDLAAHLRAAHTLTYRAGISKLRVLSRSVKKYAASNERAL